MNVISLGYTCYVKWLINDTKYKNQTDIFDWMNTFYFNKLINSLENNFNIYFPKARYEKVSPPLAGNAIVVRLRFD